jgi:hypothetical protein
MMSPVPLAIMVEASLDSPLRPANAFVGPTMPPVPIADAMVTLAMSPVHVHVPFVAPHASSNGQLRPSLHVLAHPMRSPLPRPAAGRETRWSQAHHCRRAAPDHRPAEG